MENTLLSTQSCDTISKLRGNDLLDLLVVVENTMIGYRDSIALPSKLTFGVEIEYEGVNRLEVGHYVNERLSRWESGEDASLKYGGEIRSPILRDERKSWEELKNICMYLKKHNAITTKNAGGHIHVGVPVIGDNIEAWRILLKFYMLYEHIIYRFFYGDKLNARPRIRRFAPPIAESLYDGLDDIDSIADMSDVEYAISTEKFNSLNFGHVDFYYLNRTSPKNTFELRCPNGTTEEIIWQNNINTFARMLLSAGRRVINEDFLNYKLKGFRPDAGDELSYSEIFLKEALEFSDLVFDCNLDKVYFLRQYLKSFEKSFQSSEAILAKRFIN